MASTDTLTFNVAPNPQRDGRTPAVGEKWATYDQELILVDDHCDDIGNYLWRNMNGEYVKRTIRGMDPSLPEIHRLPDGRYPIIDGKITKVASAARRNRKDLDFLVISEAGTKYSIVRHEIPAPEKGRVWTTPSGNPVTCLGGPDARGFVPIRLNGILELRMTVDLIPPPVLRDGFYRIKVAADGAATVGEWWVTRGDLEAYGSLRVSSDRLTYIPAKTLSNLTSDDACAKMPS